MANDLDTQYDDLSDPERYETAGSYQSPEEKSWHKILADYRKKNVSELNRHRTLFKSRPARHWQQARETRHKPKSDLYGPLWREGELAILFGEPGAGKSILAIQIAEALARGRNSLSEPGAIATGFPKLPTANRQLSTARNVLYLDLAHTDAQFDERYSCASPLPGKLPVRYRFSPKLHRAGFGDLEIPKAFDKNFARYFEHSIKVTIEESNAQVIIIDNLSWLAATAKGTPAEQTRWLRSLKLYCHTTGASILVLAHGKSRSDRRFTHHSPLTTHHLNFPQIADIPDSVFAIASSTYAPEIRYVKLVRTGSGSDWALLQDGEVLTYQLARSAGFAGEKGGKKPKGSDSLALSTVHSSLFTGTPFLGLDYLGPSAESDHLRNYPAEALANQQAHERELNRLTRRSSKSILVDAMIDGSYQKYLKGE